MYNFEELINRLPNDIVAMLNATDQNPEWHPEGNVYIHTYQVFMLAQYMHPNSPHLLVSAIMHDLGKIDNTAIVTQDDGSEKIRAIGHEYKSLDYIKEYWELYKDIEPDFDRVFEVTKNHMKAHYFINGQMSRPFKRKKFEDNKYFSDIMKFSTLDDKGRIRVDTFNDIIQVVVNKDLTADEILEYIKKHN